MEAVTSVAPSGESFPEVREMLTRIFARILAAADYLELVIEYDASSTSDAVEVRIRVAPRNSKQRSCKAAPSASTDDRLPAPRTSNSGFPVDGQDMVDTLGGARAKKPVAFVPFSQREIYEKRRLGISEQTVSHSSNHTSPHPEKRHTAAPPRRVSASGNTQPAATGAKRPPSVISPRPAPATKKPTATVDGPERLSPAKVAMVPYGGRTSTGGGSPCPSSPGMAVSGRDALRLLRSQAAPQQQKPTKQRKPAQARSSAREEACELPEGESPPRSSAPARISSSDGSAEEPISSATASAEVPTADSDAVPQLPSVDVTEGTTAQDEASLPEPPAAKDELDGDLEGATAAPEAEPAPEETAAAAGDHGRGSAWGSELEMPQQARTAAPAEQEQLLQEEPPSGAETEAVAAEATAIDATEATARKAAEAAAHDAVEAAATEATEAAATEAIEAAAPDSHGAEQEMGAGDRVCGDDSALEGEAKALSQPKDRVVEVQAVAAPVAAAALEATKAAAAAETEEERGPESAGCRCVVM